MEQRISLITLAVRDVAQSAAFYESMGWTRVDSPDGIVVFDLIGQTLGLYPRADLARDMGLEENDLGTGATTLAYNVRDKQQVAQLLDRARDAGARILKPAHDVFWGGHIGYFADPDGHIWEIAHNPFSPLSDEGAFRWNGYS
ncbi:VOC family protein [Pseudohalocynthiibacter aestuariivivens]|uniref:VOC family protein n=1 Tax=Roseovarius pelagicus TaxID=2980108 RepID=A0ABY6DDV2_9RHOB|nr:MULTISPECIES: VOC family protein [Rhodobacterales]QIE47108.1 VOC family protein [Pseudohalocynthiibacter aestuariivivens]UXX84341.1 VOC family protein [Roseovarius pelagicus]